MNEKDNQSRMVNCRNSITINLGFLLGGPIYGVWARNKMKAQLHPTFSNK